MNFKKPSHATDSDLTDDDVIIRYEGHDVIGLQHDYQTVHKKDRDGYELFLHDLLLNAVGKDLCRVAIQPSPRPVFIKEGQFEHLYIRTGNSTRLLTTKEAIEYCKSRWKTA